MSPKKTPDPGPRPRHRPTGTAALTTPTLAAASAPSFASDQPNAFSSIENAKPTSQIDDPLPKIEEAAPEERLVAAAEMAEPLSAPIEIRAEGSDCEIGRDTGPSVAHNGEEGRGVSGEGTVKMKRVVKKTVKKIVKKLVKKKVARKVVEGLIGCENKELEKQNVVECDGSSKSLDTVAECEARNSDSLVYAPIEVQIPGSCDAVQLDIENRRSSEGGNRDKDDTSVAEHAMEAQNVGDVREKPESAAGKPSSSDVVEMEIDNVKSSGDCEGEKGTLVSPVSVEDQNVGNVPGRLEYAAAVPVEATNMSSVEDVNGEFVIENVESGCEGVCEDVGNCNQGSLKEEGEKGTGLILSGEMKALERRRRRKTEIFIGGLDKEAKEEDIRKVFGEVGELVEVRLRMKGDTGKNKGFAFVRYASADDAKQALEKYTKVEIRGKQCITEPVERNDTLLIGNIKKNWKNEDVMKLLKGIGIEKLDKVTVMPDPTNLGHSCGFGFLEFETSKDAQIAFRRLQKKDVLRKLHNIEVSWAEPLSEPDEMLKVNVKFSLAKPTPESRPTKRPSIPIHKEISKAEPKAVQRGGNPIYSMNSGVYVRSNLGDGRSDSSSTNAELLQLLREQATWRDSQRISGRVAISSSVNHLYPLSERKRPYSALGSEPLYTDHRIYPRLRMESSSPVASPSTLHQGVGLTSSTYYNQHEASYTSGYGHMNYSNRFQRVAPYPEYGDLQHHMHYR